MRLLRWATNEDKTYPVIARLRNEGEAICNYLVRGFKSYSEF